MCTSYTYPVDEMPANPDHEKCTKGRKKDCLAYSAFSNFRFFRYMRNVVYPGAENKTKAGIQKSRSKIFFVLKKNLIESYLTKFKVSIIT